MLRQKGQLRVCGASRQLLTVLACLQGDKPDVMVKTYNPGESFGELALMYNCPRAASIQVWWSVSYDISLPFFTSIPRKTIVCEVLLIGHTCVCCCMQCKTDVKVWAMDRLTFHRVLMETTQKKRKAYEGFVSKVPVLCKG